MCLLASQIYAKINRIECNALINVEQDQVRPSVRC